MLKPHTATESTPAGPSAPRDLQAALTDTAAAVGTVLDRLLPTSDGPEARLFEAMLRGITGASLTVERFEGTFKLSQNKNAADRAGVVAALGDHPIGRRMREL